MIILAFFGGLFLGFFIAAIWYKSKDITRIEMARYFDPEQPLKLKSVLDDVLQETAKRQRMELGLQYSHLSADVKELVIDNKMSELFVEMIDDLEKSIKVVRQKR